MKFGTTKTVIIVEGNSTYRAMLRKILKNLNCYIVGESSGGDEAMSLFEKKKPDIVLLDINMPQKDGLDLLKNIIKQQPHQIVIMMTAESSQGIVQSCISAGAKGYILKTDSANAIRDRIEKFLN